MDMRYSENFKTNNFRSKYCRHSGVIGLVAALLFLTGCNQEQIEQHQSQLDRLQVLVDQQGRALSETQASLKALQDQQAALEKIEFEISNINYEMMEKAFEPLLIGQAVLNITGSQVPDLIFVEWSLFINPKGEAEKIGPISFIQRVEKGKAALHFTQPLPRHNIKKHESLIEIVPTGWYLGHVAKIKN